MDQHNSNHWRQIFERGPRDGATNPGDEAQRRSAGSQPAAPFGYDDGYDPAREAGSGHRQSPPSPEEITDEAALALVQDATDYRPWILQRGRSSPVMMLHLRRYDPRSRLWQGWQIAYPHLIAADYTGDTLLSLDFGTRQFVIEGRGLDELARHLQTGSVLMVQEYAASQWPTKPQDVMVASIKLVGA
jgi:hypothetical protein